MLLLVKQWRLLPFTFLPNSSSFFKLSFSGWLSDPLVMLSGLAGELGDLFVGILADAGQGGHVGGGEAGVGSLSVETKLHGAN